MSLPPRSDEAYRRAGVDLLQADAVVQIARRLAKTTASRANVGELGGFSGAFELPAGFERPVLLSACDGVGTKLKLAVESGIHHTVGIDLVAMSVNDILVCGGEPLAFLDYVATGALKPEMFESILSGVAEGCRQAACALVGGETAEMPGLYAGDDYDLAGFCVGVVEKELMLPQPGGVQEGQTLIGLASSGLHSNGFSLVRKILAESGATLDSPAPAPQDGSIAEMLLTPTRIYVQPVLALLRRFEGAIRAMAHVTGGGFVDNIPRVLPMGLSARLDDSTWTPPPVFPWLARLGGLDAATMRHTFNCGIGYIIVAEAAQTLDMLAFLNEGWPELQATVIGQVIDTPDRREVAFC
ncbi:MAG: phosphoribosylformylglycinamidine cyclo-ligase [Vampirovibrionales bacterium]|nr:phosphoribosylformylglycinamidine cyclo-ligase [Vampirovibrionales bacterium]